MRCSSRLSGVAILYRQVEAFQDRQLADQVVKVRMSALGLRRLPLRLGLGLALKTLEHAPLHLGPRQRAVLVLKMLGLAVRRLELQHELVLEDKTLAYEPLH